MKKEEKEVDIIANIGHKYMTDDLTLTKEEAEDYFSIDSNNCIKWTDESGSYINIKGLTTFKINDDYNKKEKMFKSSV